MTRADRPASPRTSRTNARRAPMPRFSHPASSTSSAVAIMQVNVDGHPKSSNAWDSLGDALLADGQREKAREAAQKALALVETDTSETEEQRKLIRDSAQQKLDQLKDTSAKK